MSLSVLNIVGIWCRAVGWLTALFRSDQSELSTMSARAIRASRASPSNREQKGLNISAAIFSQAGVLWPKWASFVSKGI